ncbi:hypothetical protein N0V93_008379 [Gnomoniopsis smithogilvyi]|uniref:Methyltransferase domain-containing protein n=1 Tax=Gnomoniopsis smithogilvyi TaxID=1191159 RepID=A0A9W8YMU0_9PEZI|nr:hypothetical protein N0V93_008379 [Gnomoniopsis smithogilvyi]
MSFSSRDTMSTLSSLGRPSRPNNTERKIGREYLDAATSSVPYPLPIDLTETHRQIIFAQLMEIIYATPILSSELINKPPLRVLELGCDTAWWSATCHQYFEARGHHIEFVGMDIKAPIGIEGPYRQLGMDFEYVQHDLNQAPWPFEDGSFDLIMARNIALALDPRKYSSVVLEYGRLLKPNGTLEIWEHDFTVRSMRPKIQEHAGDLEPLGLYPVLDNAEFGPATDPYITQLNTWITASFAELLLPTLPCSYIQSMFSGHLVEGSDAFDIVDVKRVAIPLSLDAVVWETKEKVPRTLNGDQMVIRRTALENFIEMIEALEPFVRSASGKGQSAWDAWLSKAKWHWLKNDGFAFGECLELGVWSVKKNC